jgi:hypothetical protein
LLLLLLLLLNIRVSNLVYWWSSTVTTSTSKLLLYPWVTLLWTTSCFVQVLLLIWFLLYILRCKNRIRCWWNNIRWLYINVWLWYIWSLLNYCWLIFILIWNLWYRIFIRLWSLCLIWSSKLIIISGLRLYIIICRCALTLDTISLRLWCSLRLWGYYPSTVG